MYLWMRLHDAHVTVSLFLKWDPTGIYRLDAVFLSERAELLYNVMKECLEVSSIVLALRISQGQFQTII